MMTMKEKIEKSRFDQDLMFKNFRNLDLNVCIEGEDWISAGRLFHKIIGRGRNEHNEDLKFHSPARSGGRQITTERAQRARW